MRLRNAEVLARCDGSGELVAREGRVEVRYKPKDGRAYFASASNLKPSGSASEIEPDSFCAPGEAVQKSSKASKKPARGTSSKASDAPEKPDGDEVLVYADGACSGNPGPAGVGAVALWADQKRELSEYIGEATNNIAELMGILRALELATELGRPLRLYTDSTYSIGEVRKVLDAHPDAKLFHVRGHQGVRFNEEADELAVRAVQSKSSTGWVSP
jgi:ribonuclease HI